MRDGLPRTVMVVALGAAGACAAAVAGSTAGAAGAGGASAGVLQGRAALPGATTLTIYSSAQPGAIPVALYRPTLDAPAPAAESVPGYALVSQQRRVELPAGVSELAISDVAALIEPTTVRFSAGEDGDARVLEQNFQFDLVNIPKLLSRYIDKPVSVDVPGASGTTTLAGTLLAAGDGLVIRGEDGSVHALRQYSNLRVADVPGGLITRPTLLWRVSARRAGVRQAQVSYETRGITWWADYNLTFAPGSDANSGLLDVAAWVSILNQSGASYDEARLKLVAGDLHRAQPPGIPMPMHAARLATAAAPEGFSEQPLFEYHLYTLGRPTTLPDRSTKQLELIEPARRVPARKLLVYAGQGDLRYAGGVFLDRALAGDAGQKVNVYLEFRNDARSGLGVPLPKGRVRVSQADPADGSLQLVGEDVIDHTPVNERVTLRLGAAFDVIGERRQVDFALDTKARRMEEEIEVRLRNHKRETVAVRVRESLYRAGTWTMLSNSSDYERLDAHTVEFPVDVPADGERVLRYRVRYTW